MAEAFLKYVVKLQGVLRTIVSDRDKVFLSHFWTELFRLQGTDLRHRTTYLLQTDGQSLFGNLSQVFCFWSAS